MLRRAHPVARRRARPPRSPRCSTPGPYWVLDAERMPIVRERLVTSARAARLGLYCSCSITSSTRCLRLGPDARMVVQHPGHGLVRDARQSRDIADAGGAWPAGVPLARRPRSGSRHVHGHIRRHTIMHTPARNVTVTDVTVTVDQRAADAASRRRLTPPGAGTQGDHGDREGDREVGGEHARAGRARHERRDGERDRGAERLRDRERRAVEALRRHRREGEHRDREAGVHEAHGGAGEGPRHEGDGRAPA